MFAFVNLMIQGNALYDTVVGDEAGFFDAYEAIQVSGMEDFLEVSRVEGIVDTSDQLPKLCQEFFSEGGAHIIIIPPDNSVLVLSDRANKVFGPSQGMGYGKVGNG
ncbi:hypothetical protein QZH41_010657 [Actinostola sp. cb2023]|nr:hypothetical protein QZH41_010657 [Actinostola sp. cb2023]